MFYTEHMTSSQLTSAHLDPAQLTIPDLEQLRQRGTMKWTRYDEDVIPLWVAESDFTTCPPVAAAIQAAVDREYFGYESERDIVQPALAAFLHERFAWDVDPAWIRVVPDVVKGVAVAVDELTPAGSTVVIPIPSYYPFFDIPKATNRPTKLIRMVRPAASDPVAEGSGESTAGSPQRAGRWEFDLEALEAAFADTSNPHGVGSLILCSPYNPLGRAFERAELEAIIALADKYHVRIISDEIHAPVVYPPFQHIPTATINDTAARLTVTVIASSKGWNTAGLHCAQMIFTNEADRQHMAGVHNLRTGTSSTLGMIATAAAYTEGGTWLDAEVDYLNSNLDLLEQRLPEVLPGATWVRPEATFLLWIDVSAVPGLAESPASKILERARVAVSEGTTFDPQHGAGHIRVNFATSREILHAALDRIAAADFTN